MQFRTTSGSVSLSTGTTGSVIGTPFQACPRTCRCSVKFLARAKDETRCSNCRKKAAQQRQASHVAQGAFAAKQNAEAELRVAIKTAYCTGKELPAGFTASGGKGRQVVITGHGASYTLHLTESEWRMLGQSQH